MQTSFSELEYAGKKKQRRRDRFLAQFDAVTPWAQLKAALAPVYSAGHRWGSRACCGWSWPSSASGFSMRAGDSQAIRRFVGIDLLHAAASDATTALRFRRLLETHGLTVVIVAFIRDHFAREGLLLREGTIVDAMLIAARRPPPAARRPPPAARQEPRARGDSDMHQPKEG